MLDPEEDIETISPVVIYIALSASVVGEVVEPCRQAGINSYISKSFQPTQLLAEIERLRSELQAAEAQQSSADRFSEVELEIMVLLRQTI